MREIVCTRWGHTILINRPGMYTRWLPQLQKRLGPIVLAHSDGQALPALESAVHEAGRAASTIVDTWAAKAG